MELRLRRIISKHYDPVTNKESHYSPNVQIMVECMTASPVGPFRELNMEYDVHGYILHTWIRMIDSIVQYVLYIP